MAASPSVLALDIGGANLKAAHGNGAAILQPFELWKNPSDLEPALHELVRAMPDFDLLAVTMTGELCDCFESKRHGVHAILGAVCNVAGKKPVRIWGNDGRLVDMPEAWANPLKVAAANWLALATFAGRFAPAGAGLVVDTGSTTTDIVPLWNGKPFPHGRTDPQRLQCGELVYTGIRRTPVCALLGSDGAAEVFATTLDVYLLLGSLAEDDSDCGTADGRPATRAAAHARMARMLCDDGESCSLSETQSLAQRVWQRQIAILHKALHSICARLANVPQTVILAGSGEFLARKALCSFPTLSTVRIMSLTDQLGPEISRAACAYALAVLAQSEPDEC